MSADPIEDEWQVESGDRVFSTSLSDMSTRIRDGSLLRIDRVRNGNLRWIEAGKVPSLAELFDAKDREPPRSITGAATGATASIELQNAGSSISETDLCTLHPAASAAFKCSICLNKFCEECPGSSDGGVNCPFCGGQCQAVPKPAHAAPERRPGGTWTARMRKFLGRSPSTS